MRLTETADTRAWVIHPDMAPSAVARAPECALEEAISLGHALPGLSLLGGTVVRLARAHPATLFGKGKIEQLRRLVEAEELGVLLIDGAVTPVQQRNLEQELGTKLLDRTGLILEIFSDRAATREGALQVEMAALSYQRTRLVRAWTHLERQRGGLGFVGGPGETQIEADRRAIDTQLVRLRRQLEKVVKTRGLHRAARARVPFPVVALVGYTNAGKSTLFNRLTGARVLARDMPFATLDPTMRKVALPVGGPEVIVSDTVGFISDLPTALIAAFRATLEDVTSADLVVHVRDISHPETGPQAANVQEILGGLGVPRDVAQIELWNKADRLDMTALQALEQRAARQENVQIVSALTGQGILGFVNKIKDMLATTTQLGEVRIDFADGRKRAWLYQQGVVESEAQQEDGYVMVVRWDARQKAQFERL